MLTITVEPNFGPVTVLWNRSGETVPGQSGNTAVPTAAGTEYALNGPLAVGNNPYALQSPTIYLVFWGQDWTNAGTTTPIASIASTIAEVKTMISPQSGYLKTTTEYGSNGVANFGGAWIDNTVDSKTGQSANGGTSPATTELGQILTGKRTNNLSVVSGSGALPLPTKTTSSINSPPIYVVVRNTTSTATGDSFSGQNYLSTIIYSDSKGKTVATVDVNSIEIENGSGADAIDEVLSHELQERMTAGDNSLNDSVVFVASKNQSGWLAPPSGSVQIADGEPDGGNGFYAFPLSGPGTPTVQAVWSVAQQAYEVAQPDSIHNYQLTPRWNVHFGPTTNANGKLVNNAAFDSNFKYDLSLSVQSGESLTFNYDSTTNTDVFTWGTGQKQAFTAFDIGSVQISYIGTSNHSVILGNLGGLSSVTVTPVGAATATDQVIIAGQAKFSWPTMISMLHKTSLTAVINGSNVQYLAVDVSGPTQDLIQLNKGAWSTVFTSIKSFEVGYQERPNGTQNMLALTQDGVLHEAQFGLNTWLTLQTEVTKFGFGVFPLLQAGSIQTYNLLFTLNSADTFTPYLEGFAMPSMSGIRDFQVGGNFDTAKLSFVTDSGRGYIYWGPTIDPNLPGQTLKVARDSQLMWSGLQSADVLQGTAGDLYLGFNANGTLMETDGQSGWTFPLTHLRSSKVANWAGAQYAFALDSSGVLRTSADGIVWANQGSGFTSFDVGSLNGSNQLFGLKNNGDLWSSTGSGWHLVASGVKSFQMGNWRGAEYVFYLDNVGTLRYSNSGTAFYPEASSVQSFALGPIDAVDTLFILTGNGQLLAVSSTFIPTRFNPTPLATDVQSFQLAKFAGQNTLFALDGHGNLRSTVDGVTWRNQASQVTSFGLGLFSTVGYQTGTTTLQDLNGTTADYIFALHSDGRLQRSTGNGWTTIEYNVAQMQLARWADANYVFFRTSDNGLFSSRDGVNFISQGSSVQSFAVTMLGSVDTLIGLTTDGILQVSSGSHWSPLATGVKSFDSGFYGTTNHLVYQTWNRELYSSLDGATKALIKSQIETFGIVNLVGSGFLMALSTGGRVQSTTGTTWYDIALNTSYTSLSIGWWNGMNRFVTLDTRGNVSVWGDTVADSLSYGPATAVTFATLNGEHWLLSLGSDATLQRNDGTGWRLVTNGVLSIAVAHWAGRDYAFYMDSSKILATSFDGLTWTPQDTDVTQFAVGMQAGTTYLYDLNQAGDLKQSIGGGWNKIDGGVTSLVLHQWASANYAFYVTTSYVLKTSPDGQTWTPQATDTQSIAVTNLTGVDNLFALSIGGILRTSTGGGWTGATGGVTRLVQGVFASQNTVFFLANTGELYSTVNGTKWNDQGGVYTSFELATLNGQNYLFALRSDHTLLRSIGTGWVPVATNVKQLFQTRSSGVPLIEYVTLNRQSYSTTNGVTWNPV